MAGDNGAKGRNAMYSDDMTGPAALPGERTADMPGASRPGRDTGADGFANRLETAVLTGGRPVWRFINARPGLARWCNRRLVDRAARHAPMRPLALSTAAPYPCWSSLTDRTWFARYLPPRPATGLPPPDDVAALFAVGAGGPRESRRSTLLFPSFAQWFTDGFMMTDARDTRRTTTNHEIDLSQLYGLTPGVTQALRRHDEAAGSRGRLKSVVAGGEEWAPPLYRADGERDPAFAALPTPIRLPDGWPIEKRSALFAFGGERANTTPFTAMINTLFLREHNRLCGVIEAAHPDWDDERVFQTARNVNIVQLIKIVVEEYINHISPYWFRLLCDPRACYDAAWNRQNWVPVEFNLLYRWHSLVPEQASWCGAPRPIGDMRLDNRPLLARGLAAGFESASRTKAWRLGLFNTAEFLLPAERASVAQGRRNELAGYNDYRAAMGFPRVTRFEQISGDPRVVAGLRAAYGHVDRIEFFIGLFAEDTLERAAVPPLIGRMVAADAFSHALTNPLLSPYVFNAGTFSEQGLASIERTGTLGDLLARNAPPCGRALVASMDQAEVGVAEAWPAATDPPRAVQGTGDPSGGDGR